MPTPRIISLRLLLIFIVMACRMDVSGIRYPRAVVSSRATRWTGGVIPYVIDKEAFSKTEDADLVLEALNTWNMETCVQFRRKRSTDKNWIKITGGTNCYSIVGMDEAGEQEVSLSDPHCRYYGTYLHELGHVIGLHHEHIRPGRDHHLRINHDNIQHGLSDFYDQIKSSELMDFNLHYDLQSIMHYGSQSFTGTDGQPTIDVKNETQSHLLDEVHNKDISFLDAKVVNIFYDCSNRCKQKVACPPSGYLDQFCQCHVPETFATRRCQDKLEESWCLKQQDEGQCEIKQTYMSVYCRKTCGRCYKHKDKFQKQKKICKNFEKNSTCDSWTKRGECTRNPSFMKIKCKKSCGLCPKHHGISEQKTKCKNVLSNDRCIQWMTAGECQRNKSFMENNCAKACGSCNSTVKERVCQGNNIDCKSCKNLKNYATCEEWSRAGECQKNREYMKINCQKTCGFCGVRNETKINLVQNKYPNLNISCKNLSNDRKCEMLKSVGSCISKPNFMLVHCAKSCSNCPIQEANLTQSNCRDLENDKNCSKWAENGRCKTDSFMMMNACAKSCNFCRGNDTGCRNLETDLNCENWSKNGNCSKNANYLMINCAKTCGRCQNVTYVECVDKYDPRFCQVLKSFGKCYKNPSFMLNMCAQTCGSCDLNGENITDFTCLNAIEDEFCNMWRDDGECKKNQIFMTKNCKRSCGICRSFDKRSKRYKKCEDRDTEESCSRFKSLGFCEKKSTLMEDKCYKTCGYCQSRENNIKCYNVYSDKVCSKWKKSGECKKNPVFMKNLCTKSCDYCKKKREITTCKNLQDDNKCDKWTKENKCTEKPSYMLIMCARSCKNCSKYFQTIPKEKDCKNIYEESSCEYWSKMNECWKNPNFMLKSCAKSCGICKPREFRRLGMCKNKDNDIVCHNWSLNGECEKNPGYMLLNCAKSCKNCPDYLPSTHESIITTRSSTITKAKTNSNCNNLYRDDYCEKWKKMQFCKKYPLFMISQCGRTCGVCKKTLECQNLYSNKICEVWANEGKCKSNMRFMLMMCLKSCGKCSLLNQEIEKSEKNLSSRCENIYGELSCEAWKEIGECERNPSFMSVQCAKSCGTCQEMLRRVFSSKGKITKNIHINDTCDELIKSGQCEDNEKITPLPCLLACKNSARLQNVNVSDHCKNLAGNETCNKLKKNGLCEKKGKLCAAACGKCKQYPPKYSKSNCSNRAGDIQCSYWARQNQCKTKNTYMQHYCKKSCNICFDNLRFSDLCQDSFGRTKCLLWAKRGECDRNKIWMNLNCAQSCMVCQGNKKFRELQRRCSDKLDCLSNRN